MSNRLVIALIAALAAGSVFAANTASDSAADSAYNSGWDNGSNGGAGFGAWVLLPNTDGSTAGSFVGDSLGNGGGGTPSINTSGRAWGLYANSSTISEAYRPFTGGSLAVGQTLVFEIDNGFITPANQRPPGSPPTVGVTFQASNGSTIWEMYFRGGDSNYSIVDGSGTTGTLPFTDGGLRVEFSLATLSTYNATITRLANNQQQVISGASLMNFGTFDIDRVRFFNFDAGSGGEYDFFVNNISIVPEPGTFALAAMGLAALVLRRRFSR